MTEGWTGSLVELGVDGNLKVIVAEVGRLVQDRQHVLDHKRQGLIEGRKGGHVLEERPHSQGTCPAGFPEDVAVARHCSAPAADPPTGATLPPLPAGGTAPPTGSRLGFEHRSECARRCQHARSEENLP